MQSKGCCDPHGGGLCTHPRWASSLPGTQAGLPQNAVSLLRAQEGTRGGTADQAPRHDGGCFWLPSQRGSHPTFPTGHRGLVTRRSLLDRKSHFTSHLVTDRP